jgi:hypothetical protein
MVLLEHRSRQQKPVSLQHKIQQKPVSLLHTMVPLEHKIQERRLAEFQGHQQQ